MEKNNNIEVPLLQDSENVPPVKHEEHKKILFGQAISASILIGTANVLYGMIQNRDFPVTCLSWTGFFLVSIIFKIIEIKHHKHEVNKSVIFESFFGHLRNKLNVFHVILRSLNFYAYIIFMMAIAYYAQKAEINFGIILSISCLEIPLQSIYGYCFFHEKIRPKTLIGMTTIILGIIWITISRSNTITTDITSELTQDEINKNRIICISLAIILALMSSMRSLQAKYINRKTGYPGFQFAIDAALICGVVLFFFSVYYFIVGAESYTTENIVISFMASSIIMIFSILAINAVVKGMLGPTMALIQTHSLTSTVLSVILLGQSATIQQVSAMLIIITGTILILLL